VLLGGKIQAIYTLCQKFFLLTPHPDPLPQGERGIKERTFAIAVAEKPGYERGNAREGKAPPSLLTWPYDVNFTTRSPPPPDLFPQKKLIIKSIIVISISYLTEPPF
jgi:hypothetical protein